MAKRTIRAGIATYRSADGREGAFGFLGDEVDVHKDDLERFDRFNPAPPEVNQEEIEESVELPAGDPTDAWSNKELDAYADAHGIDIKTAKNKAEKLAAFAAAASA
jgi:hypothetical protein